MPTKKRSTEEREEKPNPADKENNIKNPYICPGCGDQYPTLDDIDDCPCWSRNYDK